MKPKGAYFAGFPKEQLETLVTHHRWLSGPLKPAREEILKLSGVGQEAITTESLTIKPEIFQLVSNRWKNKLSRLLRVG